MKFKRMILALMTVAMVFGLTIVNFAEPTEDFHIEPSTEPTEEANGPVVEEYKVYIDDDKKIEPGSLSGDVNLSTVGKGLYFDGTDFYFFLDTGIMATDFMYNIQGDRFYFGEDGKMVKNEMITYDGEIYYFDINGAMYKNRWYTAEEVDVYENTVTYTDYYFGPTGRAYRAGDDNTTGIVVKTIEEEKYGFNSDGEKVEGYYSLTDAEKKDPDEVEAYANCDYYFDPQNNGAATTGWHYYSGSVRGDEYDDNEEIVLYFDEKTCKKIRSYSDDETRCVYRTIEGQRYAFDTKGVRRNKWYNLNPGVNSNVQTTPATYSDLRYFAEDYDGYLAKGWFTAIPPKTSLMEVNRKKSENDEEVWFYAGTNGKIYRDCIRKVGHYTYAFDADGVMQEDCLVRVKAGRVVKSYPTETLYMGNVLNDAAEYGHAEEGRDPYSDPINLSKYKGLLNVGDGERWMYFYGDQKGDDKDGSMAPLNVPVKVELNDEDVYLVANSTGGYTVAVTAVTGVLGAGVTQRNNKYLQNGCLLKANPDNNNYALIRYNPVKKLTGIVNYRNKQHETPSGGTEGKAQREAFIYYIVNTSGSRVTGDSGCKKDKDGNYLYYFNDGQFLGYYSCQGRCSKLTSSKTITWYDDESASVDGTMYGTHKADATVVDHTIIKPGEYFWEYKPEKNKGWLPGLPPERYRVKPDYLALNYSSSDEVTSTYGCKGPYEDGIAHFVYEDIEVTP